MTAPKATALLITATLSLYLFALSTYENNTPRLISGVAAVSLDAVTPTSEEFLTDVGVMDAERTVAKRSEIGALSGAQQTSNFIFHDDDDDDDNDDDDDDDDKPTATGPQKEADRQGGKTVALSSKGGVHNHDKDDDDNDDDKGSIKKPSSNMQAAAGLAGQVASPVEVRPGQPPAQVGDVKLNATIRPSVPVPVPVAAGAGGMLRPRLFKLGLLIG